MKREDLLNPPKCYRPVPFWSWNERLDTKETKRQIALMNEAGIGGYFMHARGGLQTEYMGKEWFDNISAAIDEGEVHGMSAWAYDENGWPSGFAGGEVNALGERYQTKYLRIESGEKHTEHTIINVDGYHFYYDVNPFYVDTLDPEVTKVFIEKAYKPYVEKYNGRIPGFFTDEPHLSRNGIPWSPVLVERYLEEYNDDLLVHLPELFLEKGDFQATRIRFWRLIAKQFRDSFLKQIYEWCDEHDIKLTGHVLLEEGLLNQLTTNGAIMPQYEYFHIPGMDWLGRDYTDPLTPLQVSSVAHQTGKKQVISETFALTGWNTSFEDFKWIYEGQMVRGVNLLCTHLCGYSLRGIRKRDYPPSIFYQQPWWEKYKFFTDAMSRIGMLMTEGKTQFDTLLIHPQTSAWIEFNNADNGELEKYNTEFYNTVRKLEEKHIFFDLGDELMLEEKAKVENGKLILGECAYSVVVLPEHKCFFPSTEKLLSDFRTAGGVITTAEEIEANGLIDNPDIICTKRVFDDFDLYYFVNTTAEEQPAIITCGTQRFVYETGETVTFDGNYLFPPKGSLMIFDDKKSKHKQQEKKKILPAISLSGQWKLKEKDFNALTLDFCDYMFDGEIVEKHGPVTNIQGRACDLKRPVNIKMEFHVRIETVPKVAYLVCETPEIFTITVNGKVLSKNDVGMYKDSSLRMLDLENSLTEGDNLICAEVDFVQSDETYQNIENAIQFESEKNKLTYDMEIESLYLVGDFAVKTKSFTQLDRDAVRVADDFVLCEAPETLSISKIEQQGYPFFAGKMTLTKTFRKEDGDVLRLTKKHANVVSVKVNGQDAGELAWQPYELDLRDLLTRDENEVEITLYGTLRNLLGPHHQEEGEAYMVAPSSFFQEKVIWGDWGQGVWNSDYCFVHFGVE